MRPWSVLLVPALLQAQEAPLALRGVERVVLGNGLTVVLAPDTSARHVATELWIAAGSRHDPAGRRGVAHLFEHASANTAVRLDTAFANEAIPRLSDWNAQVLREFTRFYFKLDPSAVDYALATLAGRLALDSAGLRPELVRAQQDIVVNEQRNWAGGTVTGDWSLGARLAAAGYGPGHPFAIPPETEASVRGIAMDDLQRWLRERHTVGNAMLLVVGRFDPAPMLEAIRARFGALRAAPPPPSQRGWLPPPTPLVRERIVTDRTAPSLQRLFVIPAFPDAGYDAGELAARLVAAHWRTLAGDALAGRPTVTLQPGGLASDVTIAAQVLDAPRAEAALERAIAAVAGGDATDLASARTLARIDLLQRLDRLGFIGSRTEQIGFGALFADDPAHAVVRLRRLATLPVADIAAMARTRFVDRGAQIVTTRPVAASATAAPPSVPALAPAVPTPLPVPYETTAGALHVLVQPRRTLPIVRVSVGVRHEGAAAARERFERLATAAATALPVPPAITRSAAYATLAVTLTPDALPAWERLLRAVPLRGGRRTLAFTGAVTPAEATALATRLAAAWPGDEAAPRTTGGTALLPGDSVEATPGRVQTRLRAEWALPDRTAADVVGRRLVERLLQGPLGAELRERRRWSYGVSTSSRVVGDSVVVVFEAEVQADRTREAIAALRQVVAEVHAGRTATPDLARFRETLRQGVLGDYETVADIDEALQTAVAEGRPADWGGALLRAVAAVDAPRVAAARMALAPARMRLTVIGDPARVGPP